MSAGATKRACCGLSRFRIFVLPGSASTSTLDDPLAQQAAQTPVGQAYLRWSRFPFFVVQRTGARRACTVERLSLCRSRRTRDVARRHRGSVRASHYNRRMWPVLVRATFFCALAMLIPAPALAWGFEAHKTIAEHFIALLPPELKPLFANRKAYIVDRSIDPDLWRTVGWEAEPPNHFVDLDFYGKFPFAELPHEYDRAVQKVRRGGGAGTRHVAVEDPGLLRSPPARIRKPHTSSGSSYALDNIVLFAAILAHYVGDGHVPLHAVVNYDGQTTNQRGLHNRWESELFERNRARIKIAPAAAKGITDPARVHVPERF